MMAALFGRTTCLALSRNVFVSGRRSLFCGEILGIENFKRMRIFWGDKLGEEKDQFVQGLESAVSDEPNKKNIIQDTVKLVYTARTDSEVSLATELLRHLHRNQDGISSEIVRSDSAAGAQSPGVGRIHFGPLLMRLAYILGQTDTALRLWQDEELKPLFQNVTSYLILMDLLYEAKQYDRVVSTFTELQEASLSAIKFPADCTTLALAALYQMNTPESFEQMKSILQGVEQEGSKVSRRSVLFAIALAIKQGQYEYALELCEQASKKNETLLRNMKAMALAGIGKLPEAISVMEEGLWTDVPTLSRVGIMFSDTVSHVAEQVQSSNNPQMKSKFEEVRKMLESEGMLSPQTVEHFVTRTILLQRQPGSSRRSFKRKMKTPVKHLQHSAN